MAATSRFEPEIEVRSRSRSDTACGIGIPRATRANAREDCCHGIESRSAFHRICVAVIRVYRDIPLLFELADARDSRPWAKAGRGRWRGLRVSKSQKSPATNSIDDILAPDADAVIYVPLAADPDEAAPLRSGKNVVVPVGGNFSERTCGARAPPRWLGT